MPTEVEVSVFMLVSSVAETSAKEETTFKGMIFLFQYKERRDVH